MTLFRARWCAALTVFLAMSGCGSSGSGTAGGPLAWGTAQALETDDAQEATVPQIAVGANGHAFAVWLQFDGADYDIWYNRYVPGSGWGTAALLPSAQGVEQSASPRVAVDANGNALAVWQQQDGPLGIWANRYTPGIGWGSPEVIDSSASNASHPRIAMDANGNAVAAWQQFDGVNEGIWSNRYTPGSGWGTAELIETGTDIAQFPEIASDSRGKATAVWQQFDGTRTSIYVNRLE